MKLDKLFGKDPNIETFSNGETIFEEGDHAEKMFVVIEGQAEILFDGRVIETVEPGGAFGELALIDNSPRSASAVAKTDCKLVPVDRRRFLFLVKEHPSFAVEIMGIMAKRLRRQTT
jgi:CRP-like cAMP-binding protein